MFLLSLFNNVFAPSFPIEYQQKVAKEQVKIESLRKYQMIEEKKIYEDSITLKSLKMINKFTKEEQTKIREICERQEIKTKWLYKIFSIESGGNPSAVNRDKYKNKKLVYKGSGATGLIGFLPTTANFLGTDTSELKKMNVLQQLVYVEKYLEEIKKIYSIKSSSDLYLAIFRPAAIGKSNNYVIGHKNGKIFNQNPGLDINKDSVITVKDIRKFISLI
jgi:hypothetical protein